MTNHINRKQQTKPREKHCSLLWCAAVLALGGCLPKDEMPYSGYTPLQDEHYLSVSTNWLQLDGDGKETSQLNVISTNTPWQLSPMAQWFAPSPSSDDKSALVTFTAEENPSSTTARTTFCTLASTDALYDYSLDIGVTQNVATPYIRLEKNVLSFNASGGQQTVSVEANCQYAAMSNCDWLNAVMSNDGKTLTVIANQNTIAAERTGTIILFAQKDNQATISVRQAMPSKPIAKPEKLEFPNSGGTYQLTISSEVAWQATTNQSWVNISPERGQGGTETLYITAAANPSVNDRNGFVYISIGNREVLSIGLSQRGYYINVKPTSIVFDPDGSQEQFSIESNTEWQLFSKPEWVDLSVTEGTESAMVTLTAGSNNTDATRTGMVKISRKGTNAAAATISVSQPPHNFELTPATATIEWPSRGGKHQVHISTDSPWTATSTSSWMQLSERSGSGTDDIDVTMTTPDLPSVHGREDVTTFKPSLLSKGFTITTKQNPRFLEIDAPALSFFTKGGESELVNINTDATFTIASADPSWLTVSLQGNAFKATATENTTGAERRTTIVLEMTELNAGESFKLELPVRQYYIVPGVDVTTFDNEQQWDILVTTGATVSVTGFGSEQQWDVVTGTGATISIEGHGEEQPWDDVQGTGVTITIGGFDTNDNWDGVDQTGGNIGTTGFDQESDWDGIDDTDASVNVDGFGEEANWD